MNLPTLEEIIQNNKQESTFSRLLRESEILQNATYEDFIPSQEELEEVKLWIEQGKRTYLRYCEEYCSKYSYSKFGDLLVNTYTQVTTQYRF